MYNIQSDNSIIPVSEINKDNLSLTCVICDVKGACVYCSHGKCQVTAHPWCVFNTAKGHIKSFRCEDHEKRETKDLQPSSSSVFGKNKRPENWTTEEKNLLYRAHAAVPITAIDFWEQVSKLIPGRSDDECQKQWFQVLHINNCLISLNSFFFFNFFNVVRVSRKQRLQKR